MKRSQVMWRLSFTSQLSGAAVTGVRDLLAPIESVVRSEDHDFVRREFGLHDLVFTESPQELSAGELALHCLTKAHRLGVGWSILWPGLVGSDPTGFSRSDVERAALPDCLDGVAGTFQADRDWARPIVPELHAAFFVVMVLHDVS